MHNAMRHVTSLGLRRGYRSIDCFHGGLLGAIVLQADERRRHGNHEGTHTYHTRKCGSHADPEYFGPNGQPHTVCESHSCCMCKNLRLIPKIETTDDFSRAQATSPIYFADSGYNCRDFAHCDSTVSGQRALFACVCIRYPKSPTTPQRERPKVETRDPAGAAALPFRLILIYLRLPRLPRVHVLLHDLRPRPRYTPE